MVRLSSLWRLLSSLSLSLWLLLLSSLAMLAASLVATARPERFHELNTTPLWTWLGREWYGDRLAFGAVALLLALLGALAANTLACALTRLGQLLRPAGSRRSAGQTYVLWAPTLMHVLFVTVLAGHLATFSLGRWTTHTVRQGEALTYDAARPPLEVVGASRVVRQAPGPLRGGTVRHELEVALGGQRSVVRELAPLRLPNGDWLLFLPPQPGRRQGRLPADAPVDCSREERPAGPVPFDPGQPIRLKQVSDPGVRILFAGLGLIVTLMALHYAIGWAPRGAAFDPEA